MSPRVRLAVWVVAVAGALAWPVFAPSVPWVQSIFLITLLALLVTTPPAAIRLRPQASETLIAAGVIFLQAIALRRGANSAWAAIAMIAVAAALMLPLHRRNVSVWWAAAAAWAWWTMTGWAGLVLSAVVGFGCVWAGVRRVRAGSPGR